VIVDPAKSDIEESVIVGGQEGVYPAKSCIDLDTTLKAAKLLQSLGQWKNQLFGKKMKFLSECKT
jgi:hypothetical protein